MQNPVQATGRVKASTLCLRRSDLGSEFCEQAIDYNLRNSNSFFTSAMA
jgi:hypothetical protein